MNYTHDKKFPSIIIFKKKIITFEINVLKKILIFKKNKILSLDKCFYCQHFSYNYIYKFTIFIFIIFSYIICGTQVTINYIMKKKKLKILIRTKVISSVRSYFYTLNL